MSKIRVIESGLTDLVAGLAPWLAPVPTAFLVGRSTVVHLGWPVAVGIVAALIVESLGLASSATALELREYNLRRRKSDPRAPFALAVALLGVYFVVATGLTVLLDIVPGLARLAPGVFPALSLCGVTVLALRADHRRRLEAIAHEKAERRAERLARRQEAGAVGSKTTKTVHIDTHLDKARAARSARRQERLAALAELLEADPNLSPSKAARDLGLARQTIYNYLDELRENGNGHQGR